ncbi:MAG: TetR/AcrR family transcriptional regulator [Trueperella sp.]|nr:TetR/AcrR family transcriptional regulator [Trueperella sp.]
MPPERQAKLFAAAAKEFSLGFSRASLNEILRNAGFSKSSFYHYFSDKEDLFEIVVQAAVTDLLATIAPTRWEDLTADTYWSEVERMLTALARNCGEGSSAQWLAGFILTPDITSAPVSRLRTELHTWLMEFIARGDELGVTDSATDPAYRADILEAMLGATLRWVQTQPQTNVWESVLTQIRTL